MPLTPFFLVVFAGFLGVLPESLTSLIVLPEGKEVAETEGVEFSNTRFIVAFLNVVTRWITRISYELDSHALSIYARAFA